MVHPPGSAEATAAAKAVVRPLTIKDLRLQLRARGLSPAGGRDTLAARLEEHMAATCDFEIKAELSQPHPADAAATYGSSLLSGGLYSNASAGGQLHEQRLAPPPPAPAQRALTSTASAPFSTDDNDRASAPNNNYSRPAGQQNVGNYMTGRPSSRVLAPPGGATSIVFGDDGGSFCGVRPCPSAAGAASRTPSSRAASEKQQEGREEDGSAAEPAAAEEQAGGCGDGSRFEEDESSSLATAPLAAPPVPKAPTAFIVGISGSPNGKAHPNNNYARSEGQNVGNFLSGRPTSRVLAPPGGRSSITFG